MHQRWWEGLDLGQAGAAFEPMVAHVERCPFCGRSFDRRDLGQVLEHFDHQLAAGVPATDLTPEKEKLRQARKVILSERGRK